MSRHRCVRFAITVAACAAACAAPVLADGWVATYHPSLEIDRAAGRIIEEVTRLRAMPKRLQR